MKVPVRLIVLAHTPFGDKSAVLHTMSDVYGRRGFMVGTGPRTPSSLFLPMNLLEAEVTENPRASLWRASGFTMMSPLSGIRGNIYKNAISLFMSEVLYRTVTEGSAEEGLFDWCSEAVLTLDALQDGWSNFHIRFLLDLAAALGFRPDAEGLAPFAGEDLHVLQQMVSLPMAEAMMVPLSGNARTRLCRRILDYLRFHTDSAINVKSLDVLGELFQ